MAIEIVSGPTGDGGFSGQGFDAPIYPSRPRLRFRGRFFLIMAEGLNYQLVVRAFDAQGREVDRRDLGETAAPDCQFAPH
ncbi:MAG: hypothetical protein WD649_05715 [Thermoleophilaceae bacterium]